MLALLGTCLILAGSIGIGLFLCDREEERINILEQWKISLTILYNEIKLKSQPLPFALQECSCHISGEVLTFYQKVAEKISKEERGVIQAWEEELESYVQRTILGKEGKKGIRKLNSLLGYEQEETQLKMISLVREALEKQQREMEEEKRTKQKMILLLSSCGGIVMVLLLI